VHLENLPTVLLLPLPLPPLLRRLQKFLMLSNLSGVWALRASPMNNMR
jgi:hypothetical protein